MKSIDRSISVSTTIALITNAGGRCSFNTDTEYCNKILSDGRVNLGERAHIVGVNGPRANEHCNSSKNDYSNLIWLCRDHHKIIDHPSNLNIYTVSELHKMKSRHEARVKSGRYPFYGTEQSMHDYGVLSCIFHFIDIHKLYSSVSSFPVIDLHFFDVFEMCCIFKRDNPDSLPLKDPIFNQVFRRFHSSLVKLYLHLIENEAKEDYKNFTYTYNDSLGIGRRLVYEYLSSVERLTSLIERRFPQIMVQDLFDPGF